MERNLPAHRSQQKLLHQQAPLAMPMASTALAPHRQAQGACAQEGPKTPTELIHGGSEHMGSTPSPVQPAWTRYSAQEGHGDPPQPPAKGKPPSPLSPLLCRALCCENKEPGSTPQTQLVQTTLQKEWVGPSPRRGHRARLSVPRAAEVHSNAPRPTRH